MSQSEAHERSQLREDVFDFVERLAEKHSEQLRRSPTQFRARIIGLLKLGLAPHRSPVGKKKDPAVTQGLLLKRRQSEEIRGGTREKVGLDSDCIGGGAVFRQNEPVEATSEASAASKRHCPAGSA